MAKGFQRHSEPHIDRLKCQRHVWEVNEDDQGITRFMPSKVDVLLFRTDKRNGADAGRDDFMNTLMRAKVMEPILDKSVILGIEITDLSNICDVNVEVESDKIGRLQKGD